MLKLYNYFRSSASYRVRSALHWKNLPFEYLPIHLVKDGGQQNQPEFRKINPMGHVPALLHDDFLVTESVAIIQYLDDLFPGNDLFPEDPRDKAQVLMICETINSGIQPLQNLKIAKFLESDFAMLKPDTDRFTKHWIEDGFRNLENILARTADTYAFGKQVTAADCFLVPQCFAARRFGVNAEDFPNIARANANAAQLPAFQRAHPEQQPDFT